MMRSVIVGGARRQGALLQQAALLRRHQHQPLYSAHRQLAAAQRRSFSEASGGGGDKKPPVEIDGSTWERLLQFQSRVKEMTELSKLVKDLNLKFEQLVLKGENRDGRINFLEGEISEQGNALRAETVSAAKRSFSDPFVFQSQDPRRAVRGRWLTQTGAGAGGDHREAGYWLNGRACRSRDLTKLQRHRQWRRR
jgi:hypothetical protein